MISQQQQIDSLQVLIDISDVYCASWVDPNDVPDQYNSTEILSHWLLQPLWWHYRLSQRVVMILLAQDNTGKSSALVMVLPQSCIKLSIRSDQSGDNQPLCLRWGSQSAWQTFYIIFHKSTCPSFNTLWPAQNVRHFTDNIFKCIFLTENIWILISISLKFVPKSLISNIPAFVQKVAWRQSGNKPLSESMILSLLMHICVIRPQWVNSLTPGKCGCNIWLVILKLIARINILSISSEITLRWMLCKTSLMIC